jgi:hypothetical protein
MSPEFRNLLQELLITASEATKREQILRALAFSDMYGRFEDVEPAHFKTFKWIFDDDYNDNGDDDTKPVHKVKKREVSLEVDGDLEAENNSSEVEDDNSDSDSDNNSTLNPSDSGENTEFVGDDKTKFRDIEYDYSVREPFLHWLSAGNGIFHISGKLGSGKSTLMKFLCDHGRTTAELQKWAGMYSVLH